MAGLSPLLILPDSPVTAKSADNSVWLKHFKFRWGKSRTYCFEIFSAMPSKSFDFKPTRESMSFAKLFTHIASGLHGFAGVLDGSESDVEQESVNKEAVSDYLSDAFNHFNKALDNIDINHLYDIRHAKADVEPWKEFSIFDIISLGYNHTVHHIAQATVFIRLNGITPPKYRF